MLGCVVSCCTQGRWRTLFICAHPLSHSALSFPNPTPGLPCPVLPPFWLPFIGTVPLSLFPSLSLLILTLSPSLLRSSDPASLAGQGVRKAEERAGEGGRNVKLTRLLLIALDYLFQTFFFLSSILLLIWVRTVEVDSERWQSLCSN